jgi:hypothetical protein
MKLYTWPFCPVSVTARVFWLIAVTVAVTVVDAITACPIGAGAGFAAAGGGVAGFAGTCAAAAVARPRAPAAQAASNEDERRFMVCLPCSV